MTATRQGEWVAVGRVGKPHGLDGSFVVQSPSAEPERFAVGARVYAEREPAAVVSRKRSGGRLVVRLDRPVERGALLELPVDELPSLPEGEYYAFDLVGLVVEEEGGRRLGAVAAVTPGVANDVLELDTGIALPLVEACVRSVDRDGGRIVVAQSFVGSG